MKMPENTGGDYELVPGGTHIAICYRFIDLGTQQVEWAGNIKHQRKVLISWELPDELMADGRPFAISQRYTFSSHERSNFRKALESWRGVPFEDSDFGEGGFDTKNLLGVPCLLTIVHNEKGDRTYANIRSVVKVPKGTEVKPQHNPSVYLTFEDPQTVEAAWESLSDNLRETIRKSPEYQAFQASGNPEPATVGEDLDDEIPFR